MELRNTVRAADGSKLTVMLTDEMRATVNIKFFARQMDITCGGLKASKKENPCLAETEVSVPWLRKSSMICVPRLVLLVETVPRSHQIPLLSLHNKFRIYNLEK